MATVIDAFERLTQAFRVASGVLVGVICLAQIGREVEGSAGSVHSSSALGAGLAASTIGLVMAERIRALAGTVIGFVLQVAARHCLADDPKLADPLAVCAENVAFWHIANNRQSFNGMPNTSGQSAGYPAGHPRSLLDCLIP